MLSGHVTDRRGQWAEWWLASVSQPCECSASYRVTQRWSGAALVTHSTQATPPWQFATAMHNKKRCMILCQIFLINNHSTCYKATLLASRIIKWSFVVVLFGSGGNKSKNIFDILLVSVRCSYFKKCAKSGSTADILYVQKSIKTI